MKQYFFPLFITSLGLFTAYVFYALWHSEEVNPPQITNHKKEKVIEDLSDNPIIPRSTLVVPQTNVDTHSQEADEKAMLEEMTKHKDIPNLTPEQMQAQTEAVYDSLTPDEHEETMQEAEAAFEALDEHVAAMDVRLAEEMSDVAESQEELMTDVDDNTEEQTYEPMSVPENEEEVDMENEDVNNP